MILDRRASGQSSSEIEHGTGIRRSTITTFLSRVKNRGFIENLQHAGRPRKSTDREDRHVIRKALGHTRVPLVQLP